MARYSIFKGERAIWMSLIPEKSDVVIIGGGIIGVSTAYYLAKFGVSVTLIEKGVIAGEQSSRNWGFVRQQGRDPAEIPTIMRSLGLWKGLAKELGEDIGFKQAGVFYLANTQQQVADYEDWLNYAKEYQIDSHIVPKSEIHKYIPSNSGNWLAALRTPSDGRAEPSKATSALARGAARSGANIVTNCAVFGFETEAGRVASVSTELGVIKTNTLLCAGGTWSSLFCARHKIPLPQLKVRSSVLRTSPLPEISEHSIWCRDVALRRRQDGGYTIAHGSATEAPIVPDTLRWGIKYLESYKKEKSRLRIKVNERFYKELMTPRRWNINGPSPFEPERIYNVSPNKKILDEAFGNLRRLFPQLMNAKIIESWGGLIDVTPDAVPVISPVEKNPGFYLATGFSGHGFGIGPGAGELAAQMITGKASKQELSNFDYNRFF